MTEFSSPSRTRSRFFTGRSSKSATESSCSSVANPSTGSGSLRAVNPNDGRDDFGTSGRVKAQPTLRYLIREQVARGDTGRGQVHDPLGRAGEEAARGEGGREDGRVIDSSRSSGARGRRDLLRQPTLSMISTSSSRR